MRKINLGLVLLCCLLSPLRLFAQATIWQDVSPNSITASGKRMIVPDAYRTVRLNRDALMEVLTGAPMEFTEAAKNHPAILSIPLPNGKMANFRITQSPISAPNPDGKPSAFQSFSGQGIEDRTATLRCDISPAGFHAQILSSGESVYVDPFAENDPVNCISYFRRDVRRQGSRPECFSGLPESFSPARRPGLAQPSTVNGSVLRTVRSAFAATAEYTTFFRQAGDSDAQAKARALDAIKVTMNRVNGIWEKDAAVRYVLLADTTELVIIYTDPNTDPYTNSNASTMLAENQTSLDIVIGDANYDMGHVFATSSGGVGAGGVCVTGAKARGVTGLPMPVGDPFDVDFVAHEVIHQWAGNHTFNASMGGSCAGGNRNAGTAWEPGSGATLASYAGICAEANLQKNSDDYFHSGSILEILDWLTNTATCAGQVANGNTPPTVTVPASFTIPRNTPFTLTASASDPDGDTLTYGWEEFDLGAASPPETDDGTRPILRPFKPTTSPSQTFPSLTYILNNANNPPPTFTGTSPTGGVCATGETCATGEVLPSTTRTMNFRVQVRDNRVGGGGINDATTMVNVRADSGPFVVTSPNTALTVTGGAPFMITWDVANTSAAPINAANVKISLSTDGGLTFPTVLLASTPNDGIEAIVMPNTPTSSARIKVEAVDNIFFDISNVNFVITEGAPVPPGSYVPLSPARIWDSRFGPGPTGQSGPASTRTIQVAGVGGVPVTGATAVVLNLAAISPTAQTFVTAWPTGEPQPLAANLNVPVGDVRPNLVIVKLGINGQINVFNNAGNVDFAADVAGWYGETGTEKFTPISPARLWDTRSGPGPVGRIDGGSARNVPVTGIGGVPATGVTAVVLNVAAVLPSARTFITAWPAGEDRPLAANLNIPAGDVRANLVVVKVGANGEVSFFNNAGDVDLVADVAGYFATTGSTFNSVSPSRIWDTRSGPGPTGRIEGGGSRDVTVTGIGGVPATGVTAVVVNLAGVRPSARTFVTAWPAGETRPLAANLNIPANDVRPNLVVVKVGANGQVSFFNNAGDIDLVADIAGWYGPAGP